MTEFKLDPDGDDIPVYGYCIDCANLDEEAFFKGKRSCKAFKEIPLEIWTSKNKHLEPIPGDKGFSFVEAKIKV